MTFLEKVKGKNYVNHIDGNKENNSAENLEWCTPSENTKHAFKMGLIRKRGKAKKQVIQENQNRKRGIVVC